MRVGSLCSGSGIEAAAWKKLGWKHVFFSEIEDFPCAVLRYHYPKTPNLGDIRNINGRDYRGMVDLLVAGTPCQDLSVAGKRAGLAGERSGLAFQFTRLLEEICPRWFLWENVPGVLSSNRGRDFGTLLGKVQNAGMGSATAFLIFSISESPSDGAESTLSDILETGDLPQRYFLSPIACTGILRRAEKRGRTLPELLKQALAEVVAREPRREP